MPSRSSCGPYKVLALTLLGDDPATARYYAGIARTWDKQRFTLTFGTVGDAGAVQRRVAEYGHETFSLNCRSRRGYPRAVQELAAIVRRRKIDILHGNEEVGGFLCGLAGTLARKGVRIYHRQHDYSLSYNPLEGPRGSFLARQRLRLSTLNYRLVDSVAGRLAHGVFALSENHRQAVLAEHPRWGPKLHVVPHGVDLPSDLGAARRAAQEIRSRFQGSPEDRILTIVARLNWRKGHRTLFDALALLRTRGVPEPVLLVVGYGPQEEELRAAADAKGLTRTHFVGRQADVLPWFIAADITVVPSLTEPFGLVSIEAMACGRPVVASRVGGLADIVLDGETGVLVEPGDAAALCDALQRLAASPGESERMGRVGRRRFDELFTQERMTRRWEAAYLRLLEPQGCPDGVCRRGNGA